MLNLKDPTLFVEKALIGGAWLSTGSGATVAVDNPATGEVIGQIPDCDAADTQAAIAAAVEALRTWRLSRRCQVIEPASNMPLELSVDCIREESRPSNRTRRGSAISFAISATKMQSCRFLSWGFC